MTAVIFLMPVQKDPAGTWVLDTSQTRYGLAVIRINAENGYLTGALDIPGQQVYDQPVLVCLKEDKIKIVLDEQGTCFIEGILSDSSLTGISVVNGEAKPANFYRANNNKAN